MTVEVEVHYEEKTGNSVIIKMVKYTGDYIDQDPHFFMIVREHPYYCVRIAKDKVLKVISKSI